MANVSGKWRKNSRGWGKPFLRACPMLTMGFYPPRAFPCPIPLGNGTPDLIGWHPRSILVPGVLRSWETSGFPHHAAPWASFRRSSPSNPSREDAHPWESFFSSRSRGFPALLGVPFRQLLLVGCPAMGNAPLGYFPFQVQPPATPPLIYCLNVCTYI